MPPWIARPNSTLPAISIPKGMLTIPEPIIDEMKESAAPIVVRPVSLLIPAASDLGTSF
jgi:hypothetical protein